MRPPYDTAIFNQGRAAALAIDDHNRTAEESSAGGPPPIDQFFGAVQSFLSSAALISKLLWSHKAEPDVKNDEKVKESRARRLRARNRARHLRSELEITDLSPLKSRAVRNSFEHFDERLDEYFHDGETNVFDRAV